MSKAIPNPRSLYYREPNLLIPGKKPVGPVKIDWDHPTTRDLKILHYVQGLQARDLVKDIFPKDYDGTWTVDSEGYSLTVSGNGGGLEYADLEDARLGGTAFTIWWRGIPTETNNNDAFIGRRNSFSDGYWAVATSASQTVKFFCHNGSPSDVTFGGLSAYSLNEKLSLYITCDGVQEFKRIINYTKSTDTDSGAIPSGNNTHDFNINTLQYGGNNELNGVNYIAGIWHRELSDAECYSLTDDPYQFIIPA